MLRIRRNGQTSLEYIVLVVVVIGAIVGMSSYLKRGLQGRWKISIDDIGDQYDPRLGTSSINHILLSNSTTIVATVPAPTLNGFWTIRTDYTNAYETKKGVMTTGPY